MKTITVLGTCVLPSVNLLFTFFFLTLIGPANGQELPKRVLPAHENGVNSVSFSPDARFLISAGVDKTFRVWEVKSGLEVFRSEPLDGSVKLAQFMGNGKQVVAFSQSTKQTVVFWDLEKGIPIRVAALRGGQNNFALSPSEKTFLVANNSTLQPRGNFHLLDLETFQVSRAFPLPKGSGALDFAISSEKKQILAACFDKKLRVFDAGTGQILRILDGHVDVVECVAMNAAGTIAISGSRDKTVRAWDVTKGKLIAKAGPFTKGIRAVAISANGKRGISTDHANEIRVWDMGDLSEYTQLKTWPFIPTCVALSADGKWAAAGDFSGHILIWDLDRKEIHVRCQPFPNPSHSMIRPRFGDLAYSIGFFNHEVYVWDVPLKEKPRHTFSGHTARILYFARSEDDRTLFTTSDDKTIRAWDLEKWVERYRIVEHDSVVETLIFSTDGQRFASLARSGQVGIWNAKDGKKEAMFQAHKGPVIRARFSPDQTLLATASTEKFVKLWDVRTATEVCKKEVEDGLIDIQFSPSGQTVLARTQYGLNKETWWNARTGESGVIKSDQPWANSVTENKIQISGSSSQGSGSYTIIRWITVP